MSNNTWGIPDAEYIAMREKRKRENELLKQACKMAETLADDILTQCQSKGFTEKQIEELADYLKRKINRAIQIGRESRVFIYYPIEAEKQENLESGFTEESGLVPASMEEKYLNAVED